MTLGETVRQQSSGKGRTLGASGVVRGSIVLTALFLSVSCSQQMANQPSLKPLEQSSVFPNGQSARQPVAGTVPSSFSRMNWRINSLPPSDPTSNELPFPLSMDVLERGRQRFGINCAACHGRTGEGDGMVARRGYSSPPTFHDDRLRAAPLGHFYDVMTNGFGGMPSYSGQVEPQDRWAIAAYIRALQLSENAAVSDVPPERQNELEQ